MEVTELEPGVELEVLTADDIEDARKTQGEIESLAGSISDTERKLNSEWVRFGVLVHKVRSRKYWMNYGHDSFGQYVQTLENRIGRKRAYIYMCVGAAEKLLPQLTAESLVEMGISRANELQKFVTNTGRLVPEEMVELALNPESTLEELKARVANVTHGEPEENTRWFDLGGFYVTPDDKALIEEATKIAKSLDPVIAHDVPDHVQRKEVIIRWCQEFMSTYAGA